MRKILFYMATAVALLGVCRLHAQDAGIHFAHGSFQEVLAQAKSEQKIVFVDAYTEWCGPCKWMSKTTFPDSAVGALFNAHFVSYKMDMEKGEGPEIAKKYEVKSFPTLLFLDGDGAVIDVTIGARGVEDFLALGQKVIKGGYETFPAKKARFEQGLRDRDFLHDYLIALYEAGQDAEAALEAYKPGMSGAAMLDQKNWDIFDRYFSKTTSEQFQYVESHLDEFKAKFGDKPVMRKIAGGYINEAYNCILDYNDAGYEAAVLKVRNFQDAWADEMLENLALTRLELRKDWKGYVQQAESLIEKYNRHDAMSLNDFAWALYEGKAPKKQLKKALEWVEASVKAQPNYANLDTQAMILYDLGRKDEARRTAEAAIAAAKAAGQDYSETEKVLATWK
jgi:thiol-disulfide isomerase/thioredoxin